MVVSGKAGAIVPHEPKGSAMKLWVSLLMGIVLVFGNAASASDDAWSPQPLAHDQLSLRGALTDCLSAYYIYSNPVPFWLEDRDFCTIGHSPFFHGGDVSSKSGHQMDVIDIIEQIRPRFTHPKNSAVQQAFSRDLQSCLRTYVEVQSMEVEDHCTVSPSDRTAVYWRTRARTERRVPLSLVIRVIRRLVPRGA